MTDTPDYRRTVVRTYAQFGARAEPPYHWVRGVIGRFNLRTECGTDLTPDPAGNQLADQVPVTRRCVRNGCRRRWSTITPTKSS